MAGNMDIYGQVASVPDYAKKTIGAGRLKGMTDISPMWRIEQLTNMFGPCGIGWWYEIISQRIEKGAGDEAKAFVDILLYYKWGDEVSKPIPGIGGSTFITKENKGLYTSDECFKMALTDAISVAAKALGFGADVYMGCDRDKYNTAQDDNPPPPQQQPQQQRQQKKQPYTNGDGFYMCEQCGNVIEQRAKKDGTIMYPKDIAAMAINNYGRQLCVNCAKQQQR